MTSRRGTHGASPSSRASLLKLPVLILDCQSTGASPANGHLLEIAWCVTSAAVDLTTGPSITSRLAALPRGSEIPRRITAITGISNTDLRGARPPKEIWRDLRCDIEAPAGPRPLVVHFARFEIPFLEKLRETSHEPNAAPFNPICTHEIARRLFPDLPRRGLHALAGYLLHDTPELKRASSHVAATVVVWRALVERLTRGLGIDSEPSLRTWLQETPPLARGRRAYVYTMDRSVRQSLPDSPGVYRFLGGRGEILYVGKATSLRRRVNSYFQKQKHASDRTLDLLTRARDLQVTPAGSPLEAALLEADLIKQESPPYNVSLRARDSRVWFLNRDLRVARPRPGPKHSIGPLTSAGADDIAAVGNLARLLEEAPAATAAIRAGLWGATLPLPAPYHPGEETLEEGLRLFSAVRLANDDRGPRELLLLGGRLWLERLREREAITAAAAAQDGDGSISDSGTDSDSDNDSTETPAPGEPSPLDSIQVACALEQVTLRAARRVRLARWLTWLAESTLAFDSATSATGRRALRIEGGKVIEARDFEPHEPGLPPPSRAARTWRERQRGFDAAGFDRLRVLTTELKMLVRDGRTVQVVLGPGIRLDSARLGRALAWL